MNPRLYGTWEIIWSDIADYFSRPKEYHHFGRDGFMRLIIPEAITKIHIFRYQIIKSKIHFTNRMHAPLWTCEFNFFDDMLLLTTKEGRNSKLKIVDDHRITGLLKELISYKL